MTRYNRIHTSTLKEIAQVDGHPFGIVRRMAEGLVKWWAPGLMYEAAAEYYWRVGPDSWLRVR